MHGGVYSVVMIRYPGRVSGVFNSQLGTNGIISEYCITGATHTPLSTLRENREGGYSSGSGRQETVTVGADSDECFVFATQISRSHRMVLSTPGAALNRAEIA